jgi:hypothetical protein
VSLKHDDGGTGGGVTGTYYTWESGAPQEYINWRSWAKIVPQRYRVTDETIQALQGNGNGKFRWSTTPGVTVGCSGQGACNPHVFWKYDENQPEKPFFSKKTHTHGGAPGNIHWCSRCVHHLRSLITFLFFFLPFSFSLFLFPFPFGNIHSSMLKRCNIRYIHTYSAPFTISHYFFIFFFFLFLFLFFSFPFPFSMLVYLQ